MINVIRLTSVLKKLQFADHLKKFLNFRTTKERALFSSLSLPLDTEAEAETETVAEADASSFSLRQRTKHSLKRNPSDTTTNTNHHHHHHQPQLFCHTSSFCSSATVSGCGGTKSKNSIHSYTRASSDTTGTTSRHLESVVIASINSGETNPYCGGKMSSEISNEKSTEEAQTQPQQEIKNCKKLKTDVSSSTPSSSSSNKEGESNMTDIVKFLELVGNLKHLKRTGWLMRNVKDCESISGHMYRMSMVTFLLDDKSELNRTKCMELALVHDLAESLVGDITPFCGVSREEKQLREIRAMEEICKLIEPNGKRLLELFLEYEAGKSPESKFVKDLDRLDLVLQAFEYEKRDNCIMKHQEFFDSAEGKILNPFVIKIIDEIKSQRESLASGASGTTTGVQSIQNGYTNHNRHQNGDVNDITETKISSS